MSKKQRIPLLIILVCCFGLSSALTTTSIQAARIATKAIRLNPTIDQITQQVLFNIRSNGFNPNASTKKLVTGGLYVNWQMNNPSRTNGLNVSSNDDPPSSHDIQTDLYYLNALAEYKHLHPTDSTYDQDVQKILPIVHYEFFNYNLPKGWLYFYLLRTGLYLNDQTLVSEANMAASNYYNNWYDPKLSLLYNKAHDPGVYSVEHTVTASVALMDAGTRWNQPQWLQAGKTALNTALSASYNLQTHLFYNNMSVNENATEVVLNDQAKPSTQGSIVEALMDAYMLTHTQQYLDIAEQVLQSMLITSGLWDQNYGGLYFALDLNSNRLQQKYKETRSQAHTLIGLYRYNQVLRMLNQPQKYLDKQQQLINLLSTNFYEPTYHGYFYRLTPTFQNYISKNADGELQNENYFTTEAMGIALDALQQTEMDLIPF